MTSDAFNFCVNHVLEVEGGYSDRTGDRGGPTNLGITHTTLAAYRGVQQATVQDVRALTVNEARDIYYALFWLPARLERVKDIRIACIIFDQVVNRGLWHAARLIQDVLNRRHGAKLAVDGSIGPLTIDAINSSDPVQLAYSLIRAAQEKYASIVVNDPTQVVNLRGWLARTWKLWDIQKA